MLGILGEIQGLLRFIRTEISQISRQTCDRALEECGAAWNCLEQLGIAQRPDAFYDSGISSRFNYFQPQRESLNKRSRRASSNSERCNRPASRDCKPCEQSAPR